MKKVLIFRPVDSLKPTGGPEGYLNNLKKSLDKLNYKVDFLSPQNQKPNKSKKWLPRRIVEFLRAIKYMGLIKKSVEVSDGYLQYDVIHFHYSTDMYYCREFLKKYKGIVVLTSHSPCVYYKEMISKLNKFDYKLFHKQLDRLSIIDEYAFKRADYIVFPCKEAEEPYYNSWEDYKKIRNSKKIKYLYTGINECIPKISSSTIRKKYGILESDFVVCYVGRHNEIKGYDNLIRIGLKAIGESQIKMLVAGKNEPIKGPSNKDWTEVGWTNDPYSIINAADLFLLPNKDTFFDLIMLEVLSLGKIVLTTYTGGNKNFKKFKNAGIFYYNGDDDCVKKIDYIKSMSKDKIKQYESTNKKLFNEKFTSDLFAKKYIELIEHLK